MKTRDAAGWHDSAIRGEAVFLDEWRRDEDTANRLKHVRAEEREASKTTVVPGIAVGDWTRFRAALVGDAFWGTTVAP